MAIRWVAPPTAVAGSREQGAGSREQGAGSREQGAIIFRSKMIKSYPLHLEEWLLTSYGMRLLLWLVTGNMSLADRPAS